MDYIEQLKNLRFTFRQDEVVDYQLLVSIADALLNSSAEDYEKNKEELFHTFQILVLVYGLEDQLTEVNYSFSSDDINDINAWKYIVVHIFADLEKDSSFMISNETKELCDLMVNKLDNATSDYQENINNNCTCNEVTNELPVQPEPIELTIKNTCNNVKDNKLDQYNWEYLEEYLKVHNLIPYKCSICGAYEWNGEPLKLKLSYKNNIKDKDINNLTYMCPNCYSQFGKKD